MGRKETHLLEHSALETEPIIRRVAEQLYKLDIGQQLHGKSSFSKDGLLAVSCCG